MSFISAKNISIEKMLDCIGDAIMVADNEYTIHTANDQFAKLYNVKKEQIIGLNPFVLFPEFKKSVFYEGAKITVETGEPTMRIGYSERFKKWMSLRTYRYDENNYIAVIKELNDSDNSGSLYRERIDLLTSLPNRLLFEEDLNMFKGSSQPIHLIMLDINRFRNFNETFGKEIGNMILMSLAQRLKLLLDSEDRLYRISGDQFLILSSQNKDFINDKINKITKSFEEEFVIKENKHYLTPTIVLLSQDSDKLNNATVLQCVESTLLLAKKNKIKFLEYNENSDTVTIDFALERKITDALKNNEMELFYQPQGDLIDNKVVGAEALIRWKNPETGQYVPPIKFLPAAEEMGLMGEIDKWVINDSFSQIAEFYNLGTELNISINLSSDSICNPKIIDYIKEKMEFYQIPGKLITVEITETSLMSDIDKSKDVVSQLKELGISLAIDDFGTGYSSMGYLLKYPAQYLKIDREFVKDILKSETHKIMVQNIIRLGKSIGMQLIAEGAELQEEIKLLKEMDCDFVQGYGYSKPLPIGLFKEFIKTQGVGNKASDIN